MNKKTLIFISVTVILSLAIYFGISNPCTFAKCEIETSTTVGVVKTTQFTALSVEEFKLSLESNDVVLLDVRTAEEFAVGKINGATQIDFYQTTAFRNSLSKMDKTKQYLVYCRSGNRSGQTLDIMKDLGFENVSDLRGGITGWTNSGYEIVE